MYIIKFITLLLIFGGTSFIGILMSKKYENRLKELKEIKNAIHMLEIKIKFTYDPIPKLFREIEPKLNESIGRIFGLASEKMETLPAEEACEESLFEVQNNLQKKDKEILKEFGELLGQTNVEGQISRIKLTCDFLDMQISEATVEKRKNEKLYKTLRNGSRSCYCNYIGIETIKRKVQNGYKFII